MLQLKLVGKSAQSLSKLANWNRDTHKLKNSISQLLKGVQSSITTLKCSEESNYRVRIEVLKALCLYFSSYGHFCATRVARRWLKLRNYKFATEEHD